MKVSNYKEYTLSLAELIDRLKIKGKFSTLKIGSHIFGGKNMKVVIRVDKR